MNVSDHTVGVKHDDLETFAQNSSKLLGVPPMENFLSIQGGCRLQFDEVDCMLWTGQAKYVPNGHPREMNNGSAVPSATSNSVGAASQGSEMLSSMLAAATPEHQKQMLGERLYPLVMKHKYDLASKITGMLLEMDNSELLLLLESPESLATKVEEAVKVLKVSNTKVAGQEAVHPNYLSVEVAVS